MGKPKQMRPGRKCSTTIDLDLHGEDSWVIVKKQRVTILIPPQHHTRKSISPKVGPIEVEAIPKITVNNQSAEPVEPCARLSSIDVQEKATQIAANRGITVAAKPPAQHFSVLRRLPKQNAIMGSGNSNRVNTFTPPNMLGVSCISKTIKRPRQLHGPGSFLEGCILPNQRLRGSLLEKKLQRAGGLSRWLASIGLEQFVRIFQGNGVGKFQLANLTMKKLKDMGANAVGPRRKLMHAIDCVCQPYCFEAL